MDFVGVLILGSIVAVGGGTLRDLFLGNVPVFWVADPEFVVVGAVAAAVTIPLFHVGAVQALQNYRLVDSFDAAGMALFVITGTNVVPSAGANDFSAAIIGTISGVGGGMIRDVLANQIPGVLKSGHLYATRGLRRRAAVRPAPQSFGVSRHRSVDPSAHHLRAPDAVAPLRVGHPEIRRPRSVSDPGIRNIPGRSWWGGWGSNPRPTDYE